MTSQNEISRALGHLSDALIAEIIEASTIKEFPKNTVILREGQYVKVIPIVIKGLIKVFTSYEDRDLLLYYIRPQESCIMSFSASLKNDPSKIVAVSEEDTKAILLPVEKVSNWIRKYPEINSLFFQQYHLRYGELLDTINHVLFDKMDKRLYDYLKEKMQLSGTKTIKISHRQIAKDLGTAREVISRVMKKLESEGKVHQHSNSIEIL